MKERLGQFSVKFMCYSLDNIVKAGEIYGSLAIRLDSSWSDLTPRKHIIPEGEEAVLALNSLTATQV